MGHLFGIADIARHRMAGTCHALGKVHGAFKRILAATGDHDLIPLMRQRQGTGTPDTRTSARHQSNFLCP